MFYDDGPIPGWMLSRDTAAASIFTMLLERKLNEANTDGFIDYDVLAAEAWEIAEIFKGNRPHIEGEPGTLK